MRKANDALSASNIRLRTSQIIKNSPKPKNNNSSKRNYNGRVSFETNNNNSRLSDDEVASIREKVIAIYRKYDPKREEKVDGLMEKYKGRENALMNKLVDRYEGDHQSVLSEMTHEAKSSMSRSQLAMQRHKERMQSMRSKRSSMD